MLKTKKMKAVIIIIAIVLMAGFIADLDAGRLKITASSIENNDLALSPENVLDGDIRTRWSSQFEDIQWLLIDLGMAKDLYGMHVLWEDAYTVKYSIMVSQDKESWVKVFSTDKGKKGLAIIDFKRKHKVRYIKFDLRKRGTEWGHSILEIFLKTQKDQEINIPGYSPPRDTKSWKWEMVWNDEFNGPEIDKSKWNFVVSGGGFGNNEKQYYTDRKENVYIENGYLVIKALDEPYKGESYTSAKLFTENKGDWLYGKFEIRAKMPKGKGMWPAIWMMPTGYDKNYGPWPACGEIDIVEYLGHKEGTVHGTIHFGKPHTYKGNSYHLPPGKSFANDFYIFALEWDPDQIRWYCNREFYGHQADWFTSGNADWPAPFDRKFYLQLNLAVGGNWPGYPDSTTVFPQTMMVDYVRVYKLNGERPAKPVKKTK